MQPTLQTFPIIKFLCQHSSNKYTKFFEDEINKRRGTRALLAGKKVACSTSVTSKVWQQTVLATEQTGND
jgi:hypothetical protein